MDKAIVLLSGGCDSTTTLHHALNNHGYDIVTALNITYGQKHGVEKQSARDVAAHYGVRLECARIKLAGLLDSNLLEGGDDVPMDREGDGGVAPTYVPARNSILLSVAAGWADSRDYNAIFYGAHEDDHTGYPDCRPEYFRKMKAALEAGTENGVTLNAPFIDYPKSFVVEYGVDHDVPYHLTHTCYDGKRPACGHCDSCRTRLEAFHANGTPDPLDYEDPEVNNVD